MRPSHQPLHHAARGSPPHQRWGGAAERSADKLAEGSVGFLPALQGRRRRWRGELRRPSKSCARCALLAWLPPHKREGKRDRRHSTFVTVSNTLRSSLAALIAASEPSTATRALAFSAPSRSPKRLKSPALA